MDVDKPCPSMGEAASLFLNSLPPNEREPIQPEIYKFIRWYGWERFFSGLTPPEVANYAERLSSSDRDYVRKLETVRTFLVYAKKAGWSNVSLAAHLKVKKGKHQIEITPRKRSPQVITLTAQIYAELECELASLKDKRLESIDEIRRAAADKDFRENAPLEAAREQRGFLEGRIGELEETLKSAIIGGEKKTPAHLVGIGDTVLLRNLDSEEELRYMLVNPREIDSTGSKISIASPIGKAILGQSEGRICEIIVPAGKLRYQIQRIERNR